MIMEDNIEMVKIDGVITYEGMVTYGEIDYKTIEVDGEMYTRQDRTDVCKDLKELDKSRWSKQEYSFEEIDYNIVLENYNGFSYHTLDKMTNDRIEFSENSYVNQIWLAFYKGLLDIKIKDLATINLNKIYYKDFVKDSVYNNNEVPFIYDSYGWGNAIYYSISLEDFLELDFKKIKPNLKDILKKEFNISFNKGAEFRNANNVMKAKLKRKAKEEKRRKEYYNI